jgi:L-lactate dehydrogenase
MKVSIIGGGGLVGSCAGFALQAGKIVRHIHLVDVNQELCEGQALDLLHGASILADQKITSGDMKSVGDSDCVVITAGLRRKPEESRLDLINRNVALFRGILGDLKSGGLRKDAIVFVVSNPVDVLTYLAIKELGLPSSQVIGLGTVLDTTRLRSLLAQRLDVPPTQVDVTIFGEHGDSMVPIWSAAQIAGLPLEKVSRREFATDRGYREEDPGQRSGSDQEEGGRGLCRGRVHRGRRARNCPGSATDSARQFAAVRRLRPARRRHFGSHRCRSQGSSRRDRGRSVAEGKDGIAEVRQRTARNDREGSVTTERDDHQHSCDREIDKSLPTDRQALVVFNSDGPRKSMD